MSLRDTIYSDEYDIPSVRYVPSGRERFQETIIMSNKSITEMAIELTVEVTEICDCIKGRSHYTNQLMRCASSIGANAHEAKYAQSRADFINKLEISLKECHETEFWLEILFRVHSLNYNQFNDLKNKCGTIRRKLIASITTAKNNSDNIRN